MKLSDLRRLAVRKQLRVSFTLPNGMEALIDEHGLSKVPALRAIPDFNIEDGLAQVHQFRLEPVTLEGRAPRPQNASLADVEKLLAQLSPSAAAAADHDD